MKKGVNTQYEAIKNHLLKYGKITSWDAIQKYGVTRLSQYIYLMRKEGYKFNVDHVPNTKKNGWYSLYILIDEGGENEI